MSFDLLATTGIGCLIVFFGKWIVSHVKKFRDWGLPAPVLGGLVVSIILSALKYYHIIDIKWTPTLSSFLMNIFFTVVGFGFSKSLLEKGRKYIVPITVSVVAITVLQGILGIVLANVFHMNPLFGLQIGPGALAGGVGTTAAFGKVYEAYGAVGATEIGVSAATVGMILGSLLGGPIAVLLIKKHNLKPHPEDEKLKREEKETVTPLDVDKLLKMVCMIIIIAACGIPIYTLLNMIPMIEMPYFIGCLFAGAISRNVLEGLGVKFYMPEIEAIESISLDIFLAITIMTMDLTKIASAMGPMLIILAAETLLMFIFTYYIAFRMYHSDYSAAVMCAGFVGMGMGSGSNAVAAEQAVINRYGYAHVAWVLYPAFSVLVVDIANPIFMSVVGSMLK